MEKVSVLIPVFNRELYIRDCLSSVLGQTYSNLSILVYDDGSIDGTVSIVQEISKKDSRVRLIVGETNQGVGHARNVLLASCETSVACWQDSDDLSNIHRIQKQMALYNSKSCPLVLAGYQIFRNGRRIDPKEKPAKYVGFGSARATILFTVDKSIKFIESKILGGEDIAWFVVMRRKYSVQTVREVLYYIRFHSDRIGWLKWRLKREPKISIRGKSYEQLRDTFGVK